MGETWIDLGFVVIHGVKQWMGNLNAFFYAFQINNLCTHANMNKLRINYPE